LPQLCHGMERKAIKGYATARWLPPYIAQQRLRRNHHDYATARWLPPCLAQQRLRPNHHHPSMLPTSVNYSIIHKYPTRPFPWMPKR
jgi:hypothetical protein